MEIVVAKTSGFCFGVDKAVKTLFELLEKTNDTIYTLGPIIHNERVVKELESKGVKVIQDISEASEGSHVVIRTHGVPIDVYDYINKNNIKVTDATCPYVKKIHNLVSKKQADGYKIIIAGDKNHPEVVGINGWCRNSAIVIGEPEEAESLVPDDSNYCVVAQTTFNREKWEKIIRLLKNKYKNLEEYDTICNATTTRQLEVVEISKSVDMMLVIGGKNSSNTQKLFEISSMYCQNTYKIETAGDLPPVDIKRIKKIGVTAGASTPQWIVKEVLEKMNEIYTNDVEESFMDAFEKSFISLQTGQIVKGKVVGFNNSEVYVDIGYKSDGTIPADQFVDSSDTKISDVVKIGDEVEASVVRVNDAEGTVLLSKRKVDAIKGIETIEKAYETKETLTATVTEVINGGVIALCYGLRVFIPASQIGERYEKDLTKYINAKIKIRIIEFDKKKKRIVGSQRVVLKEEKEKKLQDIWNSIEIGKKYTGVVKSFTNFGAFVDIGGVDGLIHLSELSWGKIKHPSEVLKIGQQVEVTVLEFDKEKNRISLGYKKEQDNPWYNIDKKYKVGDVVKGTVVRLVPFGAFIELEKGVDGLVHISQISNIRIAKPDDVLKQGQEVEAKILDLDVENKKISLSIKEVNPIDKKVSEQDKQQNEEDKEEEIPTEHKEDMVNTIGDVLNGKIDIE